MAMTLIVLAATMGNKYGGLKQLEGIGPNGETILDFSIYDAVRVGFNKIVFVISRHFEQEFKKLVSGKYEHVVEVEYVYQDVETIPEEKRNPKRKALYGSVRAVLMGEELIDSPFGVINAVNFYQRESFELLYNNLVMLGEADYHSFNICYRLRNVLAESGGVTRGICEVDEKGYLLSVTDRVGVERISGNPMYPNELHKWVALDDNSLVSMNMWGFTPQVFGEMKKAFDKFIDENGMDMKAHYSIPAFMNERIADGVRVKVIETPARWMGLVSHDDKIQVLLRINDMIRKVGLRRRLRELLRLLDGLLRLGLGGLAGADGLDHPAGGVAVSRAGGQGQHLVIHMGRHPGVQGGQGQAAVQKALAAAAAAQPQAVDVAVHAHLPGGEDLIPVGAAVVGEVHIGVGLPIAAAFVLAQGAEHGAVVHPVSVDDGVEVAQIAAVPIVHEDGPHGVLPAPPGVVKIVAVVRPLDHGVGHPGAGDEDPAQHVRVLLPQGGEVHVFQRLGVGVLPHGDLLRGLPLPASAGGARSLAAPVGHVHRRQVGQVGQPGQLLGLGIGLVPLAVLHQLEGRSAQAEGADHRQQGGQSFSEFRFHGLSSRGYWNSKGPDQSPGPCCALVLA